MALLEHKKMTVEADLSWDIPNPTSLNARKQLDGLFELLPQDSPLTAAFKISLSQNALLPTLSRFMLRPSLTLTISWTFRPFLIDLCARWLDTDDEDLEKLEALGLLIEVHEELFPIISLFLQRFESGPLYTLVVGREVAEIDRILLHRVLLAYYRILRATPAVSRHLNWDLACLLKLCANPLLDRGARWLAIRCYSMQSSMSESARIRMEKDALGEICDEDCPISYGETISGAAAEVDGWMLPVLEMSRVQDYRNSILESPDYFTGSEKTDVLVKDEDLSPRTANIHGILLLRSSPSESTSSSLVLTSPALLTVRQLAINISLRRPTLLTSTPSSGKTTFLTHLASHLFSSSPNQIITIHLADSSLDPRSLLGSYVSSSTSAGSFDWNDGVLVKAMREGRWVVLKDIDRASNEVLGLITPLVESMDDIKPIGSNATLSLGNRGTVEAAESFSLFATRSVEGNASSSFPPLSFLGAQKWQEITVPENSLDDLRLIVNSKFPSIAGPVSDSLIDIWLTVKRLRVLTSSRPVGIRDLEKFCSRVCNLLDSSRTTPSYQGKPGEASPSIVALLPHPLLREEIYLDARDVFFAAGAFSKPALEQRDAIASAVGEKLGLSEETREWLLKRRTPAFEIEKDVDGRPITVRAGRTSLGVGPVDSLPKLTAARPFSMHKQALRLISQLATCVATIEPVLLTGETGTGKTSVISHLASLLNKPLIALNLSNQTESSDLIGGFRPVSAQVPALELQHRFTGLFQKTFSNKKNEQLLQSLRKAVANGKWKVAVKLWTETARMAMSKLKEKLPNTDTLCSDEMLDTMDSPTPRKRRKVQGGNPRNSMAEWTTFDEDVRHFEVQHVLDKGKFSFHYVEGPLVKAIRTGAWVLLDEINLASPETLECIAGLLQGPTASVTLTEQGLLEPVPRHLGFRLFACMNPATDVGKKDLPSNIRARFTEIEVPPPDEDNEVLVSVIAHYIGHLAVMDKAVISNIAELYTDVKCLAASGKIADGSNHKPHYSMRSLSRALTFAADTIQCFGLRRALWEGFTMTFTMALDRDSAELVLELARRTLLSNVKNTAHFLTVQPPPPQNAAAGSYINFGPFWLSSGPTECEEVPDYILTPSVQKKLVDLSRIVMTKRYPVLIEGPTSSGKTSAIQYLARRTGHNFVRINNHEHTDIQEYLGSYVSDPNTGKLVFRDGLLVRALRRGDWIVLDELNLAPTDVLEALNRLLDDNRELVIPDTQEVIRPHADFVLFATQNPPGVYAGRKVLSRALRNRFLEVHFADVPPTELEHILCQRSRIAPSYSQRIVAVFHELQKRRQVGRIFEGKEGFATLRDLFRWANRDAQGYQELAENGYMLLAERTRRPEDKLVVKEVIEKVMNVTISENSLYSAVKLGLALKSQSGIVWTRPMQRLFILLLCALSHDEPVLLVGETGSGKTSVCQVYAEIENGILRTVNCHQNTEAADIIGGLRPIRQGVSLEHETIQEALKILGATVSVNEDDKAHILELITTRLREKLSPRERDVLTSTRHALLQTRGLLGWQDGPLVTSMRHGGVFLLDEISLADDSVLERLNSVLEPSRTLILAEKGGETADEYDVVARPGFKFVATMNPGGDFGKKELSPALRNRFTEVWVPSLMNREDLAEIVKQSWRQEELVQLTGPLLDFVDWMMLEAKDTSILTLRDVLGWVKFCNILSTSTDQRLATLFVHGGEMTILDGLYSLTQLSAWSLDSLRFLHSRGRRQLRELISEFGEFGPTPSLSISVGEGEFRIGPFFVSIGSQPPRLDSFSFKAPTSLGNAFRLIRACQIAKPILLEGSPGVGKTSLVTALAAATGQKLCRINLSEQTDLVDLFGSDLPVEGNASGNFGWSDAEFLRALKDGHWVLLDEMNLATQSVLEGLNAVFDHRGTVYVPELDRSFSRHPNFRVFAAQNPLSQGSGRKGLPKSFLNRFTKVYIEHLTPDDLLLICQHLFPSINSSTLRLMITFTCQLHHEVAIRRRFGISGAPWEFNLRDIMRWASLMTRPDGSVDEPWKHLNTIYGTRFRTESDRTSLLDLFTTVFNDSDISRKTRPTFICTPGYVACGASFLQKGPTAIPNRGSRLLPSQLDRLESALASMVHNWLVIVSGSHSSGKTSFVRALASSCGRSLHEMSLGSSSDTSDLIGSFEQTNVDFRIQHLLESLLQVADACIAQAHLYTVNSLDLLLRLKGEAIAARQSRSLGTLQEVVRRSLEVPLISDLDEGLLSPLNAALDNSSKVDDTAPRFEWIDGPLVRALRQGHWLLLDNANLCSPSVLDRLNSLCEMNGSIVLTERGADQEVVYPHPDFRLIMTMDPYRGEISRAMRNRGIEISLESTVAQDVICLLLDAKRLPLRSLSFPSRPTYELLRRGLRSASGTWKHDDAFFGVDEKMCLDFLSSRLAVFKALYTHFGSSYDIAITLFVFSHSSAFDSKGLLRLPSTFGTPRAMLLSEQLSPLLESSNDLRLVFEKAVSSHGPTNDKYRPLHPFLSSPRVDWLSDDEQKTCMIISLMLEALVLASSTELALRRQISSIENVRHGVQASMLAPLSKESESISRFVGSFLTLLRKALLEIQIDSSNSLAYVHVILELVCYSRYLREAAYQPVADFSTLHSVSGWIRRSAKALSHAIQGLEELAIALHDTYSLRTGQKVEEIWNSLYRPMMPSRALGLLKQLAFLPTAMQRRVIDLVSLVCATREGTDEMDETFLMAEDILARSRNDSDGDSEISVALTRMEDNLATLTIEMNDLAQFGPFVDKSKLKDTVRILESSVNLAQCAPRIIAYQQLLWKRDVNTVMVPDLVAAHLEWHRALWNYDELTQTSGPSAMCTPILLQSDIAASSAIGTGALKDIELGHTLLSEHITRSMSELSRSESRERSLIAFFLRSFELILCVCFPDLDEDALRQLKRVSVQQNDVTSLAEVLRYPVFKPFDAIRLALEALAQSVSWIERVRAMGKCWIVLSQSLLSLYVPNIPIDPVRVRGSKESFRKAQVQWIQSQIHIFSFWERCRSGNGTNVFTRILENRIRHLEDDSNTKPVAHNVTRGSDYSLLRPFWNETRNFLSEMMSPKRLERFILATAEGSEEVLPQESLLQDAIRNFIQRMKSVYGPLQDLMPAIELAMMQLRFGLRVLRHSFVLRSTTSLCPKVERILCFPSIRAKDAALLAQGEELSRLGFQSCDVLLLQLVGLLRGVSGKSEMNRGVSKVWSIYDRIWSLWGADLANKAEKARQAESLYRSKQSIHDATNDDPDDEQVLQLFPTFTEDDAELSASGQSTAVADSLGLSPGFARKVLGVHLVLFGRASSDSRMDPASLWRSVRFQLASTCMDGPLSSLPCNADDESLALRLNLLCDAKSRFQQSDGANAFSFYRDANLREARKAADIVNGLKDRLNKLIRLWPDQLVLQHLRDRCDSILSMNMCSPVAKMLGAIERLLLHTEDWEMFANRDNSLNSHRQSLTELIVMWRKLELSGWRSILDTEAEAFCDELGEWWFRMYDAVVRGATAAFQESTPIDSLSHYLDSLTPLVEDFIASSPLGQFKRRLHMLWSFAVMTSRFASVVEESAMKRASQILSSIHNFYAQFADKVAMHLVEERNTIEKDIRNLVKLATWRDVNVHALQQSAQKTHKQLYKRIRTFREILRQPISSQLQVGNDRSGPPGAVEKTLYDFPLKDFGETDGNRVPARAIKFASVLSSDLRSILDSPSTSAIEELSSTIVSVQEDYAKSAPPKRLSSDELKKWNSALLVRKRRSWNDFLKELKRIGLSPNVKPEVLQRHRSRRCIMEQPPLDPFEGTSLAFYSTKVDHYFYRSIGLLNDLFQCDMNHHPDIATRELRRGMSLFESSFSYATAGRARICELIEAWASIRAFSRMLHDLRQSRGACVAASMVKDTLREVETQMVDTVDALDELHNLAVDVLRLSEHELPVDLNCLSDVHRWISDSSEIIKRLSDMIQSSERCGIVNEDDCNFIQLSVKHLEAIGPLLADLARREPRLMRFCDSIRDWSRQRPVEAGALGTASDSSDSPVIASAIVDLLLVVGQDLREAGDSVKREDADDSDHIRRQQAMNFQVSRVLRTDKILSHLRDFSHSLQGKSQPVISNLLDQTLPFLDSYVTFLEGYLAGYLAWLKSLLKFTYISGCLLRNIAQNGFCKPPEVEDTDGMGGSVENAEGTGLGQGEGKEDVSNQIEDESQFEGIKDQEEGADSRQKEDSGDGALDVDFDIGGELEDVPEKDLEDEETSMPDLDDEFGQDASEDLKPVDDDFWDNPPDDKGTENQDIGADDAKGGESGMAAKERVSQAKKETANPEQNDGVPEQEGDANENLQPDVGDNDLGEPHGKEDNAPMDDTAMPSEPQDISEESSQPGGPDEMVNEMEDLNIDEEHADAENQSQYDHSESIDGDAGELSPTGEETGSADEEVNQENGEPASKADIHAGNSLDDTVNMGVDLPTDMREDEPESSKESSANLSSSTGHEAKQSRSAGDSAEAADRTDTVPAVQSKPAAGSRGAESGQQSSISSGAPLPNPHRSLGDAMREVRRRFDEIRDALDSEPRATTAEDDAAAASTLEYAPDDSTDVDMQALGPALGEETANLNKLNFVKEDDEMQISASPDFAPFPQVDSQYCIEKTRRGQAKNEDREASEQTHDPAKDTAMNMDTDLHDLAEIPELPTDEQASSRSKEVELELNKWRRDGQPEDDSQRIWQLYDALTQSLSFSLCEQLRLILEPTRATRLMGDFRTGKRLNMKKIIPYIASNYTKDKIWLRRVRPSQREYQVLIALDDSRSMAESHSIHLAFQTLALVSKALNRLEVGDVAIASFGERMQMLHSFEDGPFTDQAGTKIVEAFKFAQTATDVRSLLESSVEALTKARERRASSSSSDLWQLEIIISDGICQDHEELRAIMRKAEEEHIQIVFIVIDAHYDASQGDSSSDASRSQNSIINMNQAMYRTINGRLELHMQRYLDSFPFEFFVVLKSVEALPDVLADTLRQFFERITAS